MADDHARDDLAQLRAGFAAFRAQIEAERRPRLRRRVPRRFLPLALVALLVVLTPLATFAAGFTDLNAGSPHNDNIAAIAAAGIARGCNPPDYTQYCPNGLVTREEMASFLARTAGLGTNPPVVNAKTAQTADTATDAANATHEGSADTATAASNAAMVGGYAPNGLVGVARATNKTLFNGVATTSVVTAQLTAPAAGFVLVNGTINPFPPGWGIRARVE